MFLKKIFGGVLMAVGGLAAVFFLIANAVTENGNTALYITIIAVGILMFIAGLWVRLRAGKSKKAEKTASPKKKYKCHGIALHGMPQGECECDVAVTSDSVIFTVHRKDSVLYGEKITSALLKSNSELVGASAGNVIAGAALFGTLGAIVASRPKSMTEYIIIINYVSGGESKSIAIAVDKTQKYTAENLVFYVNKHMVKGSSHVL